MPGPLTAEEAAALGLAPDPGPTSAPTSASAPPATDLRSLGVVAPDSPEGQAILRPTAAAPADPGDMPTRIRRSAEAALDEGTFGLSKDLFAGLGTAASAAPAVLGGRPYDFASEYSRERGAQQSDLEAFARDDPALNVGSRIAGFGASLAIPGVGFARGGVEAARAADLVKSGMKTGALMGAAAGFGESPSQDLGTRGRDALVGGGIGAAAGGVLAPVGQAFTNAVTKVLPRGAAPATFETAKDALGAQLSGSAPAAATAAEAAGVIPDAIQAEAAARRGSADALYDAATQRGAQVSADHVATLPAAVQGRVFGGTDPVFYDPALHPATKAALGRIDTLGTTATQSGNFAYGQRTVPFTGNNSVRATQRFLNQITPQTSDDGRALAAVKRAFNQEVYDLPANGAIVSGDPQAVNLVKAGNEQYRQYAGIAYGQPGSTIAAKASRVVSKMNDANLTPEQAVPMLLGASKNPNSVALAKATVDQVGRVLGPSAPEMDAVRQSAWLNLTTDAQGKALAPSAVRTNVLSFVKGPGSPVADSLLTPNQKTALLRFANSIPDSSDTVLSPFAAKALKLAFVGAATALGFQHGGDIPGLTAALGPAADVVGGVAGASTASVLESMLEGLASKDAANPRLRQPLFAGDIVGRTVARAGAGGFVGQLQEPGRAPPLPQAQPRLVTQPAVGGLPRLVDPLTPALGGAR